jgi:hypothetical protein
MRDYARANTGSANADAGATNRRPHSAYSDEGPGGGANCGIGSAHGPRPADGSRRASGRDRCHDHLVWTIHVHVEGFQWSPRHD